LKDYNGFSAAHRWKALRWFKAQNRPKPSHCHACGQRAGIIDAHSEDYSEPFGDHIGAFWLCYWCHMMVHCRFKSRRAWAVYTALIRQGKQAPAAMRRDFDAIRGFLDNPASVQFIDAGDPVETSLLDRIENGTT
jgi:hypothetical protein